LYKKKEEEKKWHFFLFKIATKIVFLWHFHVYLYYSPIWFISSIFLLPWSLSYGFSNGLKILYSL
jgi:hypothetical protein